MLKIWTILGIVLAVIGLLFALFNPLNKKIWSLSFMFFTSGMSVICLILIYLLVDILDSKIIKKVL
jgi:predicted acyltransferase